MRRSYKSLRHFQEGWSSLQTRSPASTNTQPGRRLQTPTLGNLQVRITSKMCSKTFHTTSNCGSWANLFPLSAQFQPLTGTPRAYWPVVFLAPVVSRFEHAREDA